jgi:hypothetical protein
VLHKYSRHAQRRAEGPPPSAADQIDSVGDWISELPLDSPATSFAVLRVARKGQFSAAIRPSIPYRTHIAVENSPVLDRQFQSSISFALLGLS